MADIEVKASKFLSLLLRHKPDEIGLELSSDGWASISDLVDLTKNHKLPLTPELIRAVVRTSDKQRFLISPDGARIRANQGHSLSVNLGLASQPPPAHLYHGTASRFLNSIRENGLMKGQRQFVHLSLDTETAKRVGMRHGTPVILLVAAHRMHDDGFEFFVSENGVWLTDHVPAKYLCEF